ncbi:MAG: 16S rRNA (cytosine(1402)-N(4))-methyltransferase RsmH [Thermoanaerobaculia bacterium]
MDIEHVPVLLAETLQFLEPQRGGLFVDCTIGLGGHAQALLEASPAARVLGIDRDEQALARARRRLAPFADRVRLVRGDFGRLAELAAEAGADRVAGVIADLGVSSLQLDTPERGFSFRFEAPLDMRMGGDGMTAREVLEAYSEDELARVFRRYGEERDARRIARAVVERRRQAPLASTAELRELIHRVKGSRRREGRVDPATRVFQALRIEVNRELAELDALVDQAVELLAPGGRLVVLSYHSLEDRLVKNRLKDLARGEIDPVTGRPREETRLIEVLTRRPVRPRPEETQANPRARSARLRAARRI